MLVILVLSAGAHTKTKAMESREITTADNSAVESKGSISKTSNKYMIIEEGIHYDTLAEPLDLPPHVGDIVTEFFWFGCSHCQDFEPEVVQWEKRLNRERPTAFVKIAVPGSDRWTKDARLFYAMKEVGATQAQVTKMLSLYKIEGRLNKRYPSKERIINFLMKEGLDVKKTTALFETSASVTEQLNTAKTEYSKLNAKGVPVFVVNGKYKVRFDEVKSFNDIYKIINALIDK